LYTTLAQLDIINSTGTHPSGWIWIHAQNERDRKLHIEVAKAGAWVSFDGYGADETNTYVSFLRDMKEAGMLNKTLVSHDSGWYHVGEAGGGTYQGYTAILNGLLPALKSAGFTQSDIQLVFE